MFDYAKYRDVRREYFGETNKEIRLGYKKYKKARSSMISTDYHKFDLYDYIANDGCKPMNICVECPTPIDIKKKSFFCTSPKAVPCVPCVEAAPCKKQEGNKPMRYNDNYASASANVSTPKSDTAVSRDYFLGRLKEIKYPKRESFDTLFNLHVNNTPQNFKALIDAIKNDKFTIDPKVQKKFDAAEGESWYHSNEYGIIWEGPKSDYEGYEKARADLEKQDTAARDAIMSAATAGDMKAAVEAFEAWTPVVGNA